MENDNKYESTDHGVSFRNLGTLLQGVEDRVLCELIKKRVRMETGGLLMNYYLLVELINVVGGLILGLNVDWVLLYSLSCGHVCWEKMVVAVRKERIEEKGSNALMTRVCFRPKYVSSLEDSTTWTTTSS